MGRNHIKTMAAPKSWPVERKSKKFILLPEPGRHSRNSSISLNFLLITMLGVAESKKETTYIAKEKEITVNGSRVTRISYPIGLMDVISIKDIKKNYRILIDRKGKVIAKEIKASDSSILLHRVKGKSSVNGKTQLNFLDGTNIIVEKDSYKIGDTVITEVGKNDIKDHLKLEKGNTIFLIGGRHSGELGKIENIHENKIIYKTKENEMYETLKEYAFVVGKDSPLIEIQNE
ncbi:30S ribosomal protein S4e [Candidatus Woesearchaeota archaeon]|nr:30S ribosomal protein S4e [Candidatus Woesearchaeota archaeon]